MQTYTQVMVSQNENKGRFVAEYVISDLLSEFNYSITDTDIYCPVDLKGVVSSTTETKEFNVEIKQRNKDIEKYGAYAELRVDKYNRMMSVSQGDTALLYMVLLNEETAYIFDIKKLDWDKVETFIWTIRKTQVDPSSGYADYPTYKIPYDQAIAKIDCKEYFKKWYAKP